jgi:hypothetical protein
MNLHMGSQFFRDVQIPILWGARAVLQDKKGRLSIIDLSGEKPVLEVLADEPAPGAFYVPRADGFVIKGDGKELYLYNPREKLLASISLNLPECQITETSTRIGGSMLSGNVFSGFGVGIVVTPNGMSLGAPLPAGLAKLMV